MKKLESINDSLFENFKKNEIADASAITGGRTSHKKDCSLSSGGNDDYTKWRKDSTTKSDDGCNEC